MPTRYWRAVLDQFLKEEAGSEVPATVPHWHTKIIPIKTKEYFLRTVRYYLDLPIESVASVIRCTPEAIHCIEREQKTAEAGVGLKVAQFYQKAQETLLSKQPDLDTFFDMSRYSALPTGRTRPQGRSSPGL